MGIEKFSLGNVQIEAIVNGSGETIVLLPGLLLSVILANIEKTEY